MMSGFAYVYNFIMRMTFSASNVIVTVVVPRVCVCVCVCVCSRFSSTTCIWTPKYRYVRVHRDMENSFIYYNRDIC